MQSLHYLYACLEPFLFYSVMPSVKILTDYDQLNDAGCNLILTANESQLTLMTSTELRWLYVRKEGGVHFTSKQKDVCEHIEGIIQCYGNVDMAKLNMKILLNKDPRKKQYEHIKNLIKAGADIRFKKSKEKTKIVIQNNVLFFSYAPHISKVVHKGILYTGNTRNDPMIEYYTELFNDNFSKSKKVSLDGEGNIVFSEKILKTMYMSFKEFDTKDWMTLFFGAIIGGVISLIVAVLSK
jgi:hypothetical protein